MSFTRRDDVVKAKPVDRNVLRKLPEFHKPRDFVRASKQSQDEFYGSQTVKSGNTISNKTFKMILCIITIINVYIVT